MDEYKKLLAQFVAFKTVSADPKNKAEMEKCVAWLEKLFRDNRFEVEVWRGKKSNPVVFADYRLPTTDYREAETILVYGHYDVQPANDEYFVLKEKDGRFWGRGVADNKGQTLIHILTSIQLIKQGKLGCNLKFVIDGNEESEAQPAWQWDKLLADYVLVSDGEIAEENPALEVSLRGGFNCTVRFKTAEMDLHSGVYGGVAINAASEMAKFIAGLKVADFSSGLDEINYGERKNMSEFQIKTGLLPALEVTGIKSGYFGPGYANLVPAIAEARLNFRLVCSQNPKAIFETFKKFVAKTVPDYVHVELEARGFHNPVKLRLNFPFAGRVKRHLRQVYGREVVYKHVGGGVPVVADFQKFVSKKILLVPLANADCNMHGQKENFRVDLVKKGLEFSSALLSI